MDVNEKIDQFCQKIAAMVEELTTHDFNLTAQTSATSTPILTMVYKSALELYSSDPACLKILERLFKAAENLNLQDVFTSVDEEEVRVLGKFAETFMNSGKLSEASKLFQFLTLLCPKSRPNPYTYARLAETFSALNVDMGSKMYDFILNVFPDNPPILLSAAKHFYENEQPKRALRILTHAQEICERHSDEGSEFRECLQIIAPQILRIRGEIEEKKQPTT
ncbi:MAG: hypothetical protein LBN94_01695 [Puniceicoccales bacterium]|jgi:thioredoxin-like negative regulator of GroEL|nr:hypothetical protein [Puniceicoccales bacterium]